MNQYCKEMYQNSNVVSSFAVGIPSTLCDSLNRKDKIYEPVSRVKKNQIILEVDGVFWKGKVFDWFSKLPIEDRVIACKTIDKNLSEMLVSLNKNYDNIMNCEIAFKNNKDTSSHEEKKNHDDFMIRKVNSMQYHEFSQERYKDHISKKKNAEKLLIQNLIFCDTNQYCDTFTVSQTLVQEPVEFFKIFSDATQDCAFSIPWQIVNTSELKLGKSGGLSLEHPYWMSFIDFQTYGTWIICAIEKSIWLHYFHANDSQVRKNYLNCLFTNYERVKNRKYQYQILCEFWTDAKPEVRSKIYRELISQSLDDSSDKDGESFEQESCSSEAQKSEDSVKSYILENRILTNPRLANTAAITLLTGWRVGTKMYDQSKIQESLASLINSEDGESAPIKSLRASTQNEIAYLVSLGNKLHEVENFINFLTFSKLDRCNTKFDYLCRMLLKIIDETQREITLEELLNDDTSEKKDNEQDVSDESSGKKTKSKNGVFLRKKTQPQKENGVPETIVDESGSCYLLRGFSALVYRLESIFIKILVFLDQPRN
ncbi:unnamed protein product [Moneuplotes crassus]|uniref:Uncharacterized protein n=1 Tax=Euplotes crassus TaxID=5936 RepID=A0AAD2D3R0_EUPCR|nr:unnamed protein product [Moneuplotes crassus]